MANKLGRPVGESNAREQLIEAARELFSEHPYEKVSTRRVAERAGVNASLIRYYFSNKWGLFEAMMQETIQPVFEKAYKARRGESFDTVSEVFRTYYRVMSRSPQFAKLLFRLLSLEGREGQVSHVFSLMEKHLKVGDAPVMPILEGMAASGELKPGIDPAMARLSLISLMIFPFVAPPRMLKMHGIELTEEFVERLAEHNLALLEAGLLQEKTGPECK
ncbi:TetR/AcrR family transcriptional regulator [Ferrimonas sediminicola]|uniref:TetR/AcrR family transcriptional regulator n=1 Tax=Ferrimonas sediminicola TaxID=2569538 RepID=A0A4U1BDC7_9GAMM|nr:TetR/AcrR family transcriptional regulator [Ferrimonas sediminicola]TKB48759.1 TetR/AcrR family transcriptional regulator [Ferrimonas sediminicola]